MAGVVSNEDELKKAIKGQVQSAVKSMMDKVLEENKNKIDQTVYNGYSPSAYNRTMEFEEAWKIEEMDLGDLGGGSFEPAPENLQPMYDEPFSHHFGFDLQVFTEKLPDAIYQGYQGALPKPIPARNAFKKLDHWFTENKIKRFFKSGLTQSGLKVTQVGGADKSEFNKL